MGTSFPNEMCFVSIRVIHNEINHFSKRIFRLLPCIKQDIRGIISRKNKMVKKLKVAYMHAFHCFI